ncbi:hypothetical protein [Sporolactobacillus laevolacticus]|uniref:Antitoxin VbhA domain-containing protein n=1 Tax=Sporolactobacillus laevolacticus DSM 442 TaxID=1395513 RepID=V6J0G7_9BACL|nr:hypothetical protein [Sporolactobacillus laevolacticus]EST10249.1 hypothetical protein P343_18250 [Sporolactobacillus laevolacticus DSM 442]
MAPDKLEDALKYAKHQLYLEGIPLTNEDEEAVRAVLSGKLTMKKLIESLRNI